MTFIEGKLSFTNKVTMLQSIDCQQLLINHRAIIFRVNCVTRYGKLIVGQIKRITKRKTNFSNECG